MAGDGTLVYVSGGGALVRCAAHARVGGPPGPRDADPGAAARVCLSAAVTRWHARRGGRNRSGADLWVWDLGRTTLTRVTFDPGIDTYPVWTPDGRRVIFSSDRARRTESLLAGGRRHRRGRAADRESQHAECDGRVARRPPADLHRDRPEDGRGRDAAGVGRDAIASTPLVQSPFAERNGIVSPDGRWLAYEANDSGRFEIYVRPFPEVNSGRWQVSTAGGTRPLWARERAGTVLCLADGCADAGGCRARPVVGGHDADAAGQGRLLRHDSGRRCRPHSTTSSPDGQRFLMIKEGGGSDQTAAPPQLIVVQHWVEELKRLVPTK